MVNLLRTVGVFIGWLTGSLAGLGAILYTCGYLVTRAHLNMLGLYGLFEYEAEHFVQEGAKFSIVVGYSIAEIALVLAIPVIMLSGFALVVVLGLRRIGRVRTLLQTWKPRLGRLSTNGVCRGVVYSLLLVLLVIHSDSYLDKFSEPLLVSDLLYTNIDDSGLRGAINARVGQIRTSLLKGDAKSTKGRFNDLLFGAFLAGGLLYVARQLTSRWNASGMLRGLLIAPFVVGFVIYVFLIPMLYGVLVRPTKYPVIVTDSESTTHIDSTLLFLLKKTDREFIVWDARHRRVIWIPASEVRRIEVRRIQSLFGTEEKES
jgi:hypothetical protein